MASLAAISRDSIRAALRSVSAAWCRWLMVPDDPADGPIQAELIKTTYGHRQSIVFAVACVSLLLGCYAAFQEISYAGLLFAILVVFGAWRFITVGETRQSASPGRLFVAGISWAAATGFVCGETARTDQMMLTVLGGLVTTGIAFGGALGNAGAPRFAKVQTVLFIAPYSFFAGISGKPGMIVILLQAPLWLVGIYTLIGRTHATHAKLIRAQRLTEHLAYHDALTGLPNRARLMECLAKECEHVSQQAGRSSYVLYLDLDGFKAVNDTFGHGAGDELLRAAAARFQQFMRPCDTFGRLGGDEFAAILKCMTVPQAEAVGAGLIAAAKEPFDLAGLPPITIGVSIGGTDITAPPDVRQTLHAADTMLYAAKHAGKGTLRLATRGDCNLDMSSSNHPDQ